MKIIKGIIKMYIIFFAVGMVATIIEEHSDNYSYKNSYEDNTYTTNAYITNEYTSNEYISNEYVSNEYTQNYNTDYYYVEETEAWSDTHTTAPVPEYDTYSCSYLGYWVSADHNSDVYFYEDGAQLCYMANYYGNYYEGYAFTNPVHGTIQCMDGWITDGNVRLAFYYGFNSESVMYDQVYGTEFQWHSF